MTCLLTGRAALQKASSQYLRSGCNEHHTLLVPYHVRSDWYSDIHCQGSGKQKLRLGANIKELNLKISAGAFFKSLLLTVIIVALCYVVMLISMRVFNQDFRFYESMFTEMRPECWLFALPYFILFTIMYLSINLGINYGARKDISEGKELVMNVLFNSVGPWLVVVGSFLSRLAWTGRSFSEFTLSYSMLFYIPVSVIINRKLFKMTKSVWLGALVNAALVSWLMVCKWLRRRLLCSEHTQCSVRYVVISAVNS